jgi:hypothetical protein
LCRKARIHRLDIVGLSSTVSQYRNKRDEDSLVRLLDSYLVKAIVILSEELCLTQFEAGLFPGR